MKDIKKARITLYIILCTGIIKILYSIITDNDLGEWFYTMQIALCYYMVITFFCPAVKLYIREIKKMESK